jgi:hypothetical protein
MIKEILMELQMSPLALNCLKHQKNKKQNCVMYRHHHDTELHEELWNVLHSMLTDNYLKGLTLH